jgi:hypothetical protein
VAALESIGFGGSRGAHAYSRATGLSAQPWMRLLRARIVSLRIEKWRVAVYRLFSVRTTIRNVAANRVRNDDKFALTYCD